MKGSLQGRKLFFLQLTLNLVLIEPYEIHILVDFIIVENVIQWHT